MAFQDPTAVYTTDKRTGISYNYGGDPLPSATKPYFKAGNMATGGALWNAGGDPLNDIARQQYAASRGGVLGASTTGGSAPDVSAYDLASSQAQKAYDRLDNAQRSGESSINSSYQDALKQLLGGYNTSQAAYKSNDLQTRQGYVAGKNSIGANAGSTLSGLQRLLGSRGAGGGSAYNIAAPDAVARAASQQYNDVGNQFSQNENILNTNWGQYQQNYDNSLLGAKKSRENLLQQNEQSINQNRAELQNTLAQLASQRAQALGGNQADAAQPYLNKANSILDQLSNYKVSPVDYKTAAYKAPDLASYTTEPGAAPTYQGQQSVNDYFSPALNALLGRRRLAGA